MRPELAAPAPAELAAGGWAMLPAASSARFRVRDKLVGTATGSIPVRSGSVRLAPGGGVESARVELDVEGIDTGNRHRDRDLRKPRFLAAAEHPTIVVQAGPAPAGPDGWQLAASLTARGNTVPVDLTVRLGEGDGPTRSVHISGRLDRTGLGMKAPGFIVGRMIDIEVDAVFGR